MTLRLTKKRIELFKNYNKYYIKNREIKDRIFFDYYCSHNIKLFLKDIKEKYLIEQITNDVFFDKNKMVCYKCKCHKHKNDFVKNNKLNYDIDNNNNNSDGLINENVLIRLNKKLDDDDKIDELHFKYFEKDNLCLECYNNMNSIDIYFFDFERMDEVDSLFSFYKNYKNIKYLHNMSLSDIQQKLSFFKYYNCIDKKFLKNYIDNNKDILDIFNNNN